MSEFSTLKLMGLNNTDSISHYKLSTEAQQEVLDIFFKHPQGSTLPHCSSFYFDRNKVVSVDSEAKAKHARNSGSDPVLMAAIDELNALSKYHSDCNRKTRRDVLLKELEMLQQAMTIKLQELRVLGE
ncbi:MAG: DUF3461 family protein [Motiliproteus sp.]|nr:DUF3461 family protein [Motiliproteus sp.]